MDWQPYIKASAEIMGGVPCIAGTRIPVSVVLDISRPAFPPKS